MATFDFSLKPHIPLVLPQWNIEEDLPFNYCEEHEKERRRRIMGIEAFKRIEDVERRRRVREIESLFDREDAFGFDYGRASGESKHKSFSPNLVYTVVQEEMERKRRMQDIEMEDEVQRQWSSKVTKDAEENERKERIKMLFDEESMDRRENARITRELEEKERDRRMKNSIGERSRKRKANKFSELSIIEIKNMITRMQIQKGRARELGSRTVGSGTMGSGTMGSGTTGSVVPPTSSAGKPMDTGIKYSGHGYSLSSDTVGTQHSVHKPAGLFSDLKDFGKPKQHEKKFYLPTREEPMFETKKDIFVTDKDTKYTSVDKPTDTMYTKNEHFKPHTSERPTQTKKDVLNLTIFQEEEERRRRISESHKDRMRARENSRKLIREVRDNSLFKAIRGKEML